MRRSFLTGFAIALLGAVALLAGRSCLSPPPARSLSPPPLGPSLMSPSPAPSRGLSLPPLGLQDRVKAERAIEEAAGLGEVAVPALVRRCGKGSALARADALAALEKISPDDASRAALAMLEDKNPVVLSAALHVCARNKFGPAAGPVRELLAHPDPIVRSRAVTAAARILAEKALSHILPLLEAPEAVVRHAAARAVRALTYRDFGFRHSDYPAERAKALARIRAWFGKHRAETRFRWLESRVEECLLGLASPDPFVRYDSERFLTALLGEIEYNRDAPQAERIAAVAKVRKKWLTFRPLFEKHPPLDLPLEAE